jgi:hypothetical protein
MKRGSKPMAVQVCFTLDKDNLERELDGLYEALRTLGIKQGVIVTLNQKDKFVTEGLTAHIVPACEFLSGSKLLVYSSGQIH